MAHPFVAIHPLLLPFDPPQWINPIGLEPIYYFVGIRKTVNEFAGNRRVIFVPENLSFSVLGATFVGLSNVFSSVALAEVRRVAVPVPVSPVAPFSWMSVWIPLAVTLTILTMMSPVFSS